MVDIWCEWHIVEDALKVWAWWMVPPIDRLLPSQSKAFTFMMTVLASTFLTTKICSHQHFCKHHVIVKSLGHNWVLWRATYGRPHEHCWLSMWEGCGDSCTPTGLESSQIINAPQIRKYHHRSTISMATAYWRLIGKVLTKTPPPKLLPPSIIRCKELDNACVIDGAKNEETYNMILLKRSRHSLVAKKDGPFLLGCRHCSIGGN